MFVIVMKKHSIIFPPKTILSFLLFLIYFHGRGFVQKVQHFINHGSFHGLRFCWIPFRNGAQTLCAAVDQEQKKWLAKRLCGYHKLYSEVGVNIAYVAGLRAAAAVDELEPLKSRGLILQEPFFGGTQRIESESRLVDDPVFQVRCIAILCGNCRYQSLLLTVNMSIDF